jgi:hypothetical protein
VTISLKHAFNSGKADGGDATLVQPSNWNAEHTMTMATSRILGRKTASTGVVEELTALQVFDILGLIEATRMIFQQTSAPTGWTKSATHNDKALRVVSGAVSSGGATAFSSVFGAGKATGGTSITQANLPSAVNLSAASLTGSVATSITNGAGVVRNPTEQKDSYSTAGGGNQNAVEDLSWTESTLSLASGTVTFGGSVPLGGSGTAHTHTLSLDLQYADVIIAARDATV